MDYSVSSFWLGNATGPGAQGGNSFVGGTMFLAVVLLILLLQLRERRVRMWSLVIMPIFLVAVTGAVLVTELATGPVAWLAILLGFAAGAAIGLLVASHMHVKVGPDGSLVMKGSVVAVAIWGAILLVKVYGKDLLAGTGLVDMNLVASALLAMTLGMMIFRRGYVYYRYTQMKKASDREQPAQPIEAAPVTGDKK